MSVRASILRMVSVAFPAVIYGYPRTYLVAAVRADKRLDLVPPPDAQHLPELDAVEQWGLGVVTPAVDSQVCVLFRDADPSRPIVVPWGFGSTPDVVSMNAADNVDLGEAPTRGAARIDDTVVVLLPPATFTGTINGLPASGMIVWTPAQTMGHITTASPKVRVE